jgi:hypothetical protein
VISTTAKTVTAALAIAAALGATTVQSASAKSGDGVRIAGTCSDTSTSKLKLKRDDGRLKVEFEVDQNRNGIPWNVELRKDGRLVFQGTRTTLAPSGSFSLERRIPGAATGTITASATRSGEGCSATVKAAKLVKAAKTVQAAGTVKQGVEDNPLRVNDDNGNHAATDDNGHHNGGDDNGNHLVADDSGHHGNDD